MRRHGLAALLLAATFFAIVAPSLRWFEFTNGGEDGVVVAALELRRGESDWLVPTLFGEARTKKPPLATWMSALAVRPTTVARLDDADPVRRDAAYRRLAWEIRWPGLLASCGTLLAVYALGATLHSPRLGLAALVIFGSSFFWLRWSRWATTDVQLSLWVAVANVFFAQAILRGRIWRGFILGGAALGLAMMAKGPVALLQCALPVAMFAGWRRFTPAAGDVFGETSSGRRLSLPFAAMLGVALFIVIGGWWYAWVYWHNPAVWAQWRVELTREGATEGPPDPWYSYLELLPLMFPWCVFFIVGLIDATKRLLAPSVRRDGSPIVLALLLVVAPIVVMAFFKDRKERYLLPMAAPAAILAASGLRLAMLEWKSAGKAGGAVVIHRWLAAGGAIGVILAASPLFKLLRDTNGKPLLSYVDTAFASGVTLAIAAIGFLAFSRNARNKASAAGMVGSTTLISFVSFGVVMAWASRRSVDGVSDMKPLADAIRAAHREAKYYSFRPSRPARHAPLDLTIYLNRIVFNLPNLQALDQMSGPRLFAVNQRADQEPPRPPPGWTTMTILKRGRDWWHVFASPETAPASDSAQSAVPHTMPPGQDH